MKGRKIPNTVAQKKKNLRKAAIPDKTRRFENEIAATEPEVLVRLSRLLSDAQNLMLYFPFSRPRVGFLKHPQSPFREPRGKEQPGLASQSFSALVKFDNR